MQLTELDDCFTETSTKLLLCVACLSPNDSFSTFNKEKLIRLAFFFFYPSEFFIVDLMILGDQLDTYIIDLVVMMSSLVLKVLLVLQRKW